MRDLSVLIPARNEMFLQRTIDDVLSRARADTEVIAVLDGAWPVEPINDHPRLTLIHHSEPHGQRTSTNEAARLSQAKYVMKLDAHCSVDEGFDVKLIEAAKELGREVTQVPAQYNHHAFDWVCACGWRKYQGPTPEKCSQCGGVPTREIIWQPRKSRLTTAWRFDSDLHFQYWSAFQKTPEGKKDIAETMSCLGACFFMERDRYWELGGMDEEHGSWGQMGTEVACKSWLSGGRLVCNKRTWFSHMFRTQGGDFSFPYPLSGKEVDIARKRSRELWLNNSWRGQKRQLSWLIEHFAPVPGWEGKNEEGTQGNNSGDASAKVAVVASEDAGNDRLRAGGRTEGGNSLCDGSVGERRQTVRGSDTSGLTKGIIYYSDCRGDQKILDACRKQLVKAANGIPIVSVTLAPVDLGKNIVLQLERGVLTMFRQILTALEASDADVIYFAEHDVLYHPSHFDFVPPRVDTYYYNVNTWKVDAISGHALFYYTRQTSGLCAYRNLLLEHYEARVNRVETEGYNHNMGYEPGKTPPRGIDSHPADQWMSAQPNVDIRHGYNLTRNRWRQDQFRDKRTCQGWTEAEEVPGWDRTKGRFAEFLRGIV